MNCKEVKQINEFELVAGSIGKQFKLLEDTGYTPGQIDVLGKCNECYVLYSHNSK